MNHDAGDGIPFDLVLLADRLREERATATGLELDAIKRRAMRQADASPSPRLKGQWMKSRLALTMMIAFGLMMSSTGATLAITGSSGSGDASQAQYGTVDSEDNNDNPQTLGTQEDGGPAPTGQSSPVGDTEQVAVAADGADSLPFTGFFTIPLIIGGIALLSTGFVLRRKADR